MGIEKPLTPCRDRNNGNMRICHVTPHLPPDQAANALLPFHLGALARMDGHEVNYVAHPPASGNTVQLAGPVQWLPRPGRLPIGVRQLSSIFRTIRIVQAVKPLIRDADLLHLHTNGLLSEVCGLMSRQLGIPTVLTLYGTEIWHYRRRSIDLFTRMYEGSAHVTFYSRALLKHASDNDLQARETSVIYPPAASNFRYAAQSERDSIRINLGLTERNILVNVKRLHPLAGQRHLIDSMPSVLNACPDTRLVICGSGPLHHELQQRVDQLNLRNHVTLLGEVNNQTVASYCSAADLFVLPSLLEACPTVALEALACGTPVVSSDNPGGVELSALFGKDITIVPRKDVEQLASAIIQRLQHRTRVAETTSARIENEFRPDGVWRQFRSIYEAIAHQQTS